MIKKNWLNRLSIQISAVIILFGTLALLTFSFFYYNKDYFFDFVLDLGIISDNTAAYTTEIENKLIDSNVSINNINAIEEILGTSEIYSVSIYDLDDNHYLTGSFASILEDFIIGTTIYESESIYNVEPYYSTLELKDGSIEIYTYSYALAKSVMPYISFSAIISLIIFILPTFLFIKREVNYIVKLKDEVTIMSQGDLDHPISINGNTEIAELSKQINNLRLTLKNNFITEETNRRANYELVTALSHDLRTPLTSLMGYLDIIRFKKYKNQQQYDLYLNNSIDKVNQINELANKMFEYFLVFSKEHDTELTKISLGVIYEYIIENIAVLEENQFIVSKQIKHSDNFIFGNINLLKRIINNIFSNVSKYADKNQPIIIELTTDNDNLKFTVKNAKIHTVNYIESNRIGLKSVKQMIKIHDGNLTIDDAKNNFAITINFPLIK